MNNLFRSFAGVFRPLARKPGFAIAVIVILALGIGINVATLGLLYRYYVAPLQFPHGNRVVQVHVTTKLGPYGMSIPGWQILQKKAPALADSGIYNGQGYNLVMGNWESHLDGVEATASVFTTLGVQPLLGRAFTAQSTRPGAQPVVLLSYPLWQTLFDGRASAVGSTLRLNGKLFTVIGVMPKDFNFPNAQTALWAPRVLTADDVNPQNFTSFVEEMVGRLAPGASAQNLMTQADTAFSPELGENAYAVRTVAEPWRASRVPPMEALRK